MPPNAQMARSESARITDQFRRMYDGPAWHGPALKPVLRDITELQAAARPIPNAHSIWELVVHLAAWLRVARVRLSATENIDPSQEENWPAATGSWSDALASLEREQRDLEQAILSFPEGRLNEPAPAAEPQTFYILLHGAVQHVAYHAGQIALLKKN